VGGDKQLVDQFYFEEVGITSIDTTNATLNQLTFDYEKYSHGHQLYDSKGGAETGYVSEGFDFVKAVAFNGPQPDSDLF
jgi:hypothetical protein